jgi:hypothetical protein
LSGAELGRRWGWPRQAVSRRLKAWRKAGLVTRRGDTVAAVAEGRVTLVPPPATVADNVRSDVATPELEKRNAIKDVAATVASSRDEISRCVNGAATFVPPSCQVERHLAVARCTFLAALMLATVSAGFSISGLTSIFIGAFWPVVAMGCALELGKLSAVAWLSRRSSTAGWRLRASLVALVAVLMGLNAIGAYGFLAKAHIGHQVEGDIAGRWSSADVDARIAVQAGIIADLDRRLGQIDGAVSEATRRGRTNAAMTLADSQRKARGELVAQRTAEAKALANLQVEKVTIEGQRALVEADLGPVRYLATLLGAPDDDVLRWFILVVACLLDPAAAVLLYAAAKSRRGDLTYPRISGQGQRSGLLSRSLACPQK